MTAGSSSPRVACVGDLVTDVVAHLAAAPRPGTDTPAQIATYRGGSAANVSVAVLAAGGVGRFVGCIGTDQAGDLLLYELSDIGVELSVVRRGNTGTIVVLVDSTGERSFLTDRGASIDLDAVPPRALDDVDVLHVPGYSFLEGALAETSTQIVRQATERGIAVSISTSSVGALEAFGRERFLELLGELRPDYVIANHAEYSYLLAGEEALATQATVVTNGAAATVARDRDGNEFTTLPDPVSVLDSTGAGDAFAGGFLVARGQGLDLEESLRRGNALASQTLGRPGAQLED